MGLYSTVRAVISCASCGRVAERDVQFKYGSGALHVYRVGDDILWGSADFGERTDFTVAAYGVSIPCPICGEMMEYAVFIKDGRIESVRELDDDLAAKISSVNEGDYVILGE